MYLILTINNKNILEIFLFDASSYKAVFFNIIVFQLQRLFLLAKLRGAFFINSHKGIRTLLKDKDNTAHYSVLNILHTDLLTRKQYDKIKGEFIHVR